MSKTQRSAVYESILAIGVEPTNEAVELTSEQRSQVSDLVTTMLMTGEADFSENARAKYHTAELVRKKYVPGLVSNWLRKDTRLNGGEKYQAKNPGSRSGSSDAKMKALKGLLKQFQAANAPVDKITAIEEAISTRTQELEMEKAKSIKVDLEQLSPELREELGI